VNDDVTSRPANGNIVLTANGASSDLVINQQVSALGNASQSGGIVLTAGRDLVINDTDDVDNGSADSGDIVLSRAGKVEGNAGREVVIASNVIVRSSTGSVTQVIPYLADLSTPQVGSTGTATISGQMGRTYDSNLQVQVNWDEFDPSVNDQYVEPGDPRNIQQDPNSPVDFTYDHVYTANPNAENQAADIEITITVTHDPNIVFTQGQALPEIPGVVYDLNSYSTFSLAPVPGDGIGSFPFEITPLESNLIFPEPPRFDPSLLAVTPFVDQGLNDVLLELASDASGVGERTLRLQILDLDGSVVEEVNLPVDALDQFDELTSKLPDGTYRLLLVEPGEQQGRLVYEFTTRNGRISAGHDFDGDRPPSLDLPGNVMPNEAAPADALNPENAALEATQDETAVTANVPTWAAARLRLAIQRHEATENSRSDTEEETETSAEMAASGMVATVATMAIDPRRRFSRAVRALRRRNVVPAVDKTADQLVPSNS
jgi:hypothetical protein